MLYSVFNKYHKTLYYVYFLENVFKIYGRNSTKLVNKGAHSLLFLSNDGLDKFTSSFIIAVTGSVLKLIRKLWSEVKPFDSSA